MPRTKRPLAFRLLLSVALLMCSVAAALAQGAKTDDYPKVEVFVGYSILGEVNSRGIRFGASTSITTNYAAKTGFEASVIRNFSKHFGIKGDFSAHINNESGRGPITVCT